MALMADRIKLVYVFADVGFMFDEPTVGELHLCVDGCTVCFYLDEDGNLDGMKVRSEQ